MEKTDQPDRQIESCPECQVGTLQPGAVPYLAMADGTLITIPLFPAWICDVCRHCEYDENALTELRSILGPSAQLPTVADRRRRFPPDNLPPWTRQDSRKGS